MPWILRRLLYAIPVLLGVNILTFWLFFLVNSPDQIARRQLGERHVTANAIAAWKQAHGYDKPLFFAADETGAAKMTATLFFQTSIRLFAFDFGTSDAGRDIARDIRQRMGPSLAIALPVLMLELALVIPLALFLALARGSTVDQLGAAACAVAMAISTLFFIIACQYFFARVLRLAPVSGYGEGLSAVRFLILPVGVQVLAGLGLRTRWLRALFIEEITSDHVRAARAKGLRWRAVLARHVLRTALIPLLTLVVVTLPGLFLGSLITESFFAIPGLGSYTLEAIQNQDFAIVRAMVFLGAVLHLAGLWLTDVAYVWADPRIRLGAAR